MGHRVVVVGGGWAGCSAALAARQAGADSVILLERSDDLLGTGLVGGIMRNNGRFTATEEMIALGAGTLFQTCDDNARHRNIDFPGHKHATLYDVSTTPLAVQKVLLAHGVEVWLYSRVNEIERSNGSIAAVKLEDGTSIGADVFVDATGTVGSQSYCTDHGNGCVMCVMRCPTFGPRTSLTGLAGIVERPGRKGDGSIGAMSGACKLQKESLAPEIREQLDKFGQAIIPLPEKLVHRDKLGKKVCQQYASAAYVENLIILDTGKAKLMTTFMPLTELRQVAGLENARYEDPYAGSVGNSMRYAQIAPRDDHMRVTGGIDNLFCAGEKAGLFVGHTEVIVTGTLAGHNAARAASGNDLLELPTELAVGDSIRYVRKEMEHPDGMTRKYTFSGSVYFDRMIERNFYSTSVSEIAMRVARVGLTNIFAGHKRLRVAS